MNTHCVNRKWWGASRVIFFLEMMGAADRVADGMEQSWITAHVFQLTCLLTDVSCPTCGETELYISVCEGSDHTPNTAFRHLPPDTARFSYAIEGHYLFLRASVYRNRP